MSTDLFFAASAPQSPSSGVGQNSKIGKSGPDQAGHLGTSRDSPATERDTFLQTLRKVAGETRNRSQKPRTRDERPVDASVADSDELTEADQIQLPATLDSNQSTSGETDPVQSKLESDLMAFMQMLSTPGGSTGGEATGLNAAFNVDLNNPEQLSAIKNWSGRLLESPSALTADLKTVVERIQQAISEALSGKSAIHPHGKAGQTGDGSVAAESSAGEKFLKEIMAAATGQKTTAKISEGVSASTAKLPQLTPSGEPAAAGAAGKLTGLSVTATNPENGRTGAELTGSALNPTGVRASGQPAPTANPDQSSGAAIHPMKGATQATDTAAADSARGTNTIISPTSQAIGGGENENRETGRKEQPAENASGTDQGKASSRMSPASDLNPALNRAGDVQIHNTAGEDPVSRLFQETRLTGEGVGRMEVDVNDESPGKVVKTEAASGDNAQMNSSGQNAEKSSDAAAPAKDAGASQGMNRNQTLDQIVRRAAIHLRNGQQEARIDLKPDFLGHVRMQVISENQQVTVKILAEHGFVKDMIENNLHQLKADLQQQGLEVDKVEVSVSQDSEEGANSREKLARSKSKLGAGTQGNEHHATDEDQQEPRPTPGSSDSSATIDYFA